MIDPFVPYSEPDTSPQHPLTLFELNSTVRAMLQHTLPDTFWLAAELSEVRLASNGHCYVEFVQKDEHGGTLVAKARGTIWRQNYTALAAHFERATGRALAAGLKVLVQVNVAFHELYGYSLTVCDIDPSYTIGDVALRRAEIIRQLQADGVMDMNKELPLPRLLRRIAVVSSPTAAGYGDFCDQLARSGYDFTVRLFPATMQGEHVEKSVIDALDAIAADRTNWDVAVIIRGGGATADLQGFDTYFLAANVAQFPLPVLSGIGHERDDTLIDLVAHTRLKTPTAVAAFLIDSRTSESQRLDGLRKRLGEAVTRRLDTERARLERCAGRYGTSATRCIARQRERLLRIGARAEAECRQKMLREQHRIADFPARMARAATRRLELERHRLDMAQRSIRLANPDRILALGFSITLKDGKPVRDASQLAEGDLLVTRVAKGTVISRVTGNK